MKRLALLSAQRAGWLIKWRSGCAYCPACRLTDAFYWGIPGTRRTLP